MILDLKKLKFKKSKIKQKVLRQKIVMLKRSIIMSLSTYRLEREGLT